MKSKTLRQMAIDDAYRSAESLNLSLKLTAHFIDRVNVRSPNQDLTFMFFTKCLTHVFKNLNKFGGKKVAYRCPTETLVFKVGIDKKILVLTYYFNAAPSTVTDSDILFQVPSV